MAIQFTINPDSKVYIHEADRPTYGGARMIDAGTFRNQHPDIPLVQGFILGLYHYEEPFTKKGTNQ